MDLTYFPRAVGNPHQFVVHNAAEFNHFVSMNNGMAPVFTSHNAFASFEDGQPTSVHFRNLALDLDSESKPENALLDALRFLEWADRHAIPATVNYSGAKGFHLYLHFDPEVYPLDEKLASALRALQHHVISECSIRTADDRTIGDARRLMRVPGTQWASLRGARVRRNGRYCYTVPADLLHSRDMVGIIERSHDPPRSQIPTPTSKWTLRSFLSHHHIDPHQPSLSNISYAPQRPVSDPLLRALFPKPCISAGILGPNPPHLVRFDAAVRLVQAGYPEPFIQSFFDDIAARASWVDRHNAHTRRYQVHSIVHHRPRYRPATCTKLKQAGACIGPTCSFFKRMESEPIAR